MIYMVVLNSLDEEIIIKYIEKCYSFNCDFQNEFLVIDNLTKKIYKKESFIQMVTKTLGNFTTTKNYYTNDIVEQWFNDKVNLILNEINNYLDDNLIIKSGSREWEVSYKKNGELFNYNDLINKFNHKYNKLLLKLIYQSWYSKSILKESDRLLNLPWS